MFGWEFPPYNSGGLGVACQGLARALVAQNTDLLFVLPKRLKVHEKGVKFVFADGDGGMDIAYIDSLLVPYVTSEKYAKLRSEALNEMYGSTLFEEVRRYSYAAKMLAEQEKFDIIHSHDWLSFGAGVTAKKASRRPMVAHVHATEIDRTAGHANKYIYDKEHDGVHAADKVISVSGYTKNVLVSDYGVHPDKVSVVHNGIDPGNYYTSARETDKYNALKKAGYKIVIFVGRITIMKGPDYFVYAAKKVLKYNPKVLFVFVGSGDMEGQVMGKVAQLGISDKVLFTGFLRGRELSEMYKSADLFVMPSVSEPFGLTSIEALVHNTPVLISKQSGVSEVLKHALKTDFWDVDDMADKILSVVEHKSMRLNLSRNGHKEALMCDWGSAAAKCISVYNSLA